MFRLVLEQNFITDLLTYCVSSAKADKITLVEPHGEYRTRAQLNVMLLQGFGSGKSSLFSGVKEVFHLMNFTLPGITGTINKDGELNNSALLDCAGKTLFIDEFHNLGEKARLAMLSLLEDQKYSRGLGYSLRKPVSIRKKYFSMTAKAGRMHIEKCIFSCIASGIYFNQRHVNQLALLSRFVPLRIDMEFEDMRRIVLGLRPFEVGYKEYPGGGTFKVYQQFVDEYHDVVNELPYDKLHIKNFYARVLMDLCRIIMIRHYIETGEKDVTDVKQYKFVKPYIPLIYGNIMQTTLTLSQYDVLNCLLVNEDTTVAEIAVKTGIDKRQVRKILEALQRNQIIKEVEKYGTE